MKEGKPSAVGMRQIVLIDGTGMGGFSIVFETNAPQKRLSALEAECQAMCLGREICDEEDLPIWCEVLQGEGYAFTFVDEHPHVTPYGTSKAWLANNYPQAKETYTIWF